MNKSHNLGTWRDIPHISILVKHVILNCNDMIALCERGVKKFLPIPNLEPQTLCNYSPQKIKMKLDLMPFEFFPAKDS
jgi:hypothetical protein